MIRRWARAVLVLVAGVVLAGCGPAGPSRPNTPASVPAATTAPVSDGKPLPPLDIELVLPGDAPAIGVPFRVTLQFATREPVSGVRARVEGSGAVTVVEAGAGRWRDPAAGVGLTLDATVRIDSVGSGELTGTVDVVDDADRVRYGRTDAVSVLSAGSEVLTGRAGLLQLRLDHLDHERALGAVGEGDYLRRRDEILGGGATTG